MMNLTNASPRVANCTFIYNSAGEGGGMRNYESCRPTLSNCILWGNYAQYGTQIALYSESSASINYTNIQGGRESVYVADSSSSIDWGPGNIDVDPLLTPDGHLRSNSPASVAGASKTVIAGRYRK
jgi:hypothetical protein